MNFHSDLCRYVDIFRYVDILSKDISAPVVDEAALVLHGLAAAGLLPQLFLLHGSVPHMDVGHRAFNGVYKDNR